MKLNTALFHIDILSVEHNRAVQARLFELGYTWEGGDKNFRNLDAHGIQINYNGKGSIGFSRTKGWKLGGAEVVTLHDLFTEKFTGKTRAEVRLNSEYTAVVSKEGVKVGCTTFPLTIIQELVSARDSLS